MQRAIADVWLGRAAAERSVHAYARLIVDDLRAVGADAAVMALAERMLADEERHAAICVEVASRIAGEPLAMPAARPFRDPLAHVALPLRALLRTVASCCIGESIASVWVDESARATEPKWLHAILRKHLADEIHHARVGWAHLARASADDKRVVTEWLPQLLEENLRAWRTFDARWPREGFPAFGLPSHDDTARWVDDAIHTLVLPGFRELGVDTSLAERAVAAR